MATTDTDALTEKIEEALWGLTVVYDAPHGGTEIGVHAPVHKVVTAVFPIIAAVGRKAKAEAWDEGYRAKSLDETQWLLWARVQETVNPYRETGDSDEHR